MRRFLAAAIALTMPTAPAAAEVIAVHGHWGTVRDPDRCWAVAEPVERRGGANVALVWRPAAGVRGGVAIRLSRERAATVPAVLTIGVRRFVLTGTGRAAWAPDARGDRAIGAAMRDARSMSVTAVDAGGRPFADIYPLAGAATALDAAALCARRTR